MRALTAISLLVLALLAASPAAAQAPEFTDEVSSPSFEVEYTSSTRRPASPHAISDADARALARNAEALRAEIAQVLGFPAPIADRDGRVHIYVWAFRGGEDGAFMKARNPDAETSSGYVAIRPDRATAEAPLAHQLFHLAQLAVWAPHGRFLGEGTAAFAERFLRRGAPESRPIAFEPGTPLDCETTADCDDPGRAAWPFFMFLAQRHGPVVVKEIFDRAAALTVTRGPPPIDALEAALAARADSVGRAFGDFAVAQLGGAIDHPQLLGRRFAGDPAGVLTIRSGPRARGSRTRRARLPRLALRFVEVVGSGGRGRCRRVRLSVRVKTAAATDAFIGVARGRRGAPRLMRLRFGRGRLRLPWRTCARSRLGLVLANGSPRASRPFSVAVRAR